MSRRRSGAITAALALMALGSPLMTGYGAQTTIAEGGSNQAAASDSADRRALKDEIAELTKLIEINPKLAIAYFNRGNAKDELKDTQGAIADWGKAIDINPQYANAYVNRGLAKKKQGDLQGSCADYKKAVSLGNQAATQWLNSESGAWCRNMR